jgi:hypothetical protein
MASGVLVVSSVLFAVLVVGIVVFVDRRQDSRSYSHSLRVRARSVAGGVGEASGVRVDPRMMFALVVLAGVLVGAMVVVREPIVFLGAIALLLVGYFAWGVYYLGRSRGLGTAHAVGLSAWFLMLLLTAVVSGQLLLG